MADSTVQQMHNPFCMVSNGLLMRHQDNRIPGLVKPVKKRQNLYAGLGVKVAGRFVSQNDRGLVDKGSGNGNTLPLTAR
jgi:hypothetical protein